jgi:hypothetical protein
MSVHLIQLLCPKRHCIIAMPYLSEQKRGKERTIDLIKAAEAARVFNPWCGICGSRDLVYEEGKTTFATLEEAMPLLRQLEADNLLSRQLLDEAGQSYDSQSRN